MHVDTTALGDDDKRVVDGLLAAGEHARAAAHLERIGQPAAAATLFEQLFMPEDALRCRLTAEDWPAAIKLASRAGDQDGFQRALDGAMHAGRGEDIVPLLEHGGRYADLARIFDARGEHERAADAWSKADRGDQAARALLELGRARDAGMALERHLDAHPADAPAAALLARLLLGFARYEDAIRLCQTRVTGSAAAADGEAVQVAAFFALGYETAAQTALDRLRALVPEGPTDVHGFMASDTAAGLVGAVADDDAGTARLAGRYILGEPQGGSGVGQTFFAVDTFAARPVVVRIFGERAMREQALRDFARTARAVRALGHPSVARTVEFNLGKGYVATERIAAPTLAAQMSRGGTLDWLRPALHALLDVLHAVHRSGLVHGGLKPGNLFALPGGLKVSDFGIHHLAALKSTETGGLASAWAYLSPEALHGAPASVSSDLYAAAALAYRAVTGQPAYPSLVAARSAPPADARTHVPTLDPAWSAFFARALAPAPASRFESADAMRRALPTAALPPRRTGTDMLDVQSVDAALERADRYHKRARHQDPAPGLRLWDAHDRALDRNVHLLQLAPDLPAEEAAAWLDTLAAWGGLGRGAQPVLDLLPSAGLCVLGPSGTPAAPIAAGHTGLRSMLRDFAAVADALTALHAAGQALGGFAPDRLAGHVGPRLTLAAAPLPGSATPERITADWQSFAQALRAATGLTPTHTTPDEVTDDADSAPTTANTRVDTPSALLRALHAGGWLADADLAPLLERAQAEAAAWPALLHDTVGVLLTDAGRPVVQLAAALLRAEDPA